MCLTSCRNNYGQGTTEQVSTDFFIILAHRVINSLMMFKTSAASPLR